MLKQISLLLLSSVVLLVRSEQASMLPIGKSWLEWVNSTVFPFASQTGKFLSPKIETVIINDTKVLLDPIESNLTYLTGSMAALNVNQLSNMSSFDDKTTNSTSTIKSDVLAEIKDTKESLREDMAVFQTGMSALLANLNTTVVSLRYDIIDLKTDLHGAMKELKTDIAEVKGDIAEVRDDIKMILDILRNKTMPKESNSIYSPKWVNS